MSLTAFERENEDMGQIEQGQDAELIRFFKTLTDQVITVELKNDLSITGTLKSVDQYVYVSFRLSIHRNSSSFVMILRLQCELILMVDS